MVRDGFNKFFWGFLFIMIDFRIQGFDILPDVIGFVLFAVGFQTFVERSEYFEKGKTFNFIMIFISIFSIYEQPAQGQGEGVHINLFGLVLGIVSFALILAVVYHLLMGIKDMAAKQQRFDIGQDASQKWSYFLIFQIVSIGAFILILIPPLFIIAVIGLFVAAIVLTVVLMRFMKTCGEQL